MGFYNRVAGIVGSFISGLVLDKFKLFKKQTLFMVFMIFASTVVFSFIVDLENIIADSILITCLGFFLLAYVPSGYQFASEITFPCSEDYVVGLLNTIGQLISASLVFACEPIIDSSPEVDGTNILQADDINLVSL